MLISGSERSSSSKVVPPLCRSMISRRFRGDLHQAAGSGARGLVAELRLGVDHGGDQRGVDPLFVGLLADHVLVAQRQGQLLDRLVEQSAEDQGGARPPTTTATLPRATMRAAALLSLHRRSFVEQRGQRLLEVLERAVVADHVLGPLGLLGLGQLARLALVDQRVAARLGALRGAPRRR